MTSANSRMTKPFLLFWVKPAQNSSIGQNSSAAFLEVTEMFHSAL